MTPDEEPIPLENLVVCLHQLIREQGHIEYMERQKGVGNCKACIPDEYNKNCRRYYSVTLYIVDVQDPANNS